MAINQVTADLFVYFDTDGPEEVRVSADIDTGQVVIRQGKDSVYVPLDDFRDFIEILEAYWKREGGVDG